MVSTAELPKNYAVTRPSPSRADDRETLSFLSWLLIAALFAAAMLLQQRLPVNLDVSWLLVAGEHGRNRRSASRCESTIVFAMTS